ncbi:Erv1 / Alr family protein [Cardiosporidium cionae]|uniref:Sulfhydryl oxidase n=1 Tax=Cardiosporidium cionae TaxID=476202 RepID=A0ABQ7J955_9APIC|nr:Erv1 / Alr family protein [Cardiosporidium cionae]|eukprot:KAF8820500.1 Erv1 / Alr family protein [Cardiosporidium cionae]
MQKLSKETFERCDDPSCTDRPKGKITHTGISLPPDRAEIGRASWRFLHTIAARYPQKPDESQQNRMEKWVRAFTHLYPCHICRLGFEEIIASHPPRLDCRENFSLWMCEAHNLVSEEIGGKIVPCDPKWLIDNYS